MQEAKRGTVLDSELICPETGERFSVAAIRGDRRMNGQSIYGLRLWENDDLVPRPDDVFGERLYCIRYLETYYTGKENGHTVKYSKAEAEALPNFTVLLEDCELKKCQRRHFVAPNEHDLQRDATVLSLLRERFAEWQEKGFIPSKRIERGYNTEQPVRERGWTYWHHLFMPRQLFYHGLFFSYINRNDQHHTAYGLLLLARIINYNSRLSRWRGNASVSGGIGIVMETFANQALNTVLNPAARGFTSFIDSVDAFSKLPNDIIIKAKNTTHLLDARLVAEEVDLWITDPPYADAINYHELADFFNSWYDKNLTNTFTNWYAESKSALAVKGRGQSFNQSMVDCYRNFTRHMRDNGAQVVMFTHQDAGVWADLALILWASGLQVTAAWTIQTETGAVGIKTGNYVQGTVCMVLRKQQSQEVAFLSDIQSDVEYEVKEALRQMTALDDKEDPNFADTDYQLAAYVAALRVITGYKNIEDIDVQYELTRERKPGEVSEVQKIIDSAVVVACEYLVPTGFDSGVWRMLTGEERFYMKALEIQSHGEYRTGVFSELARGFGIRDYKPFLKSGKANETRLMTALEYGNKQLGGPGFDKSLVRHLLFAIRETSRNENPRPGRQWLYDELPDYWGSRQRLLKVLSHMIRCGADIPSWERDVEAARILSGYIENDTL